MGESPLSVLYGQIALALVTAIGLVLKEAIDAHRSRREAEARTRVRDELVGKIQENTDISYRAFEEANHHNQRLEAISRSIDLIVERAKAAPREAAAQVEVLQQIVSEQTTQPPKAKR